MIASINPDTIANTVRMGAIARKPKAVFLAHDEADVRLVRTLLSGNDFRIIPAHNRENAVQAFAILVRSGWGGVLTAVDSGSNPPADKEVLGEESDPTKEVEIEGLWEDIQKRGVLLSGQRVRVTTLSAPHHGSDGKPRPNTSMLQALKKAEDLTKSLDPKKDKKDYLREGREGAIYGLACEE